MAKSKNNVVTHGLSGKVGDILVFRQVHGQTVVTGVPKNRAVDSPKQIAHQRHFQEAVIYAKAAFADPLTRQSYQEKAKTDPDKGLNAYTVAVADFMNAPEIDEIDLSAYTGKTGDLIRVKVTDDFEVKSVTVRIEKPDGTALEEGSATDSGFAWTYTATKNNPDLDGTKIIIRATDYPDNLTEKSQTI